MEVPEKRHRHRRKKRRLEDSGKKNFFHQVESLISKYLLRVIGVIFVLASLFYAATSAEKLISLVRGFQGKEIVPQPLPGAGAGVSADTIQGAYGTGFNYSMLLWVVAIAGFSLLIFFLANRTRRKEIGRLTVLVFYPGMVLLAVKQGWQPHLLFPLVLFFSILIFINGKKLKSSLASKVNLLLAWLFFGVWWGVKIFLRMNTDLVIPSILYSTLFFGFFLWAGLNRGFSGYHKWSKYTELFVISVNMAVYYCLNLLTLHQSGNGAVLWLFTLLLACVLFGAIYLADHLKREFNKTPYLFAGMILLSLVMPLLIRVEIAILFFGCLSVLLLVYARFSGEQSAVIVSLAALVLMLMLFLQEWILRLFPAAFLRNILDDSSLVWKGILLGLVTIPVLLLDRYLLKEAEVTFSKKWFTRRSYLRLMKGAILLTVYLSGYWLFTWAVQRFTANEDSKYMAWFTFSALYFILVLPVLAKQKSTFLRPFVWLSVALMISYPLFIHLTVIEMRNGFLRHVGYSYSGFALHYLAVLLFLGCLWMTGLHFVRVYRNSKPFVQGLWTFTILMILFIVLSEMDHARIITGLRKGIRIEDLVVVNRQLPYTIVLVACSLGILAIGLFRRNRFLRALALVIFAITLVKFLYLDIRAIGSTGRTILLFSSGVVVLTLSFFYRKIRTFFHSREPGHRTRHHVHHHRLVKDEVQGEALRENSVNSDETL